MAVSLNLRYHKFRMAMTSKILISSEVCNDEVILYLAARYKCNPADIITRFMRQEKIVKNASLEDGAERIETPLEENEIEILRDMRLNPTEIEFV